MKTLFTVFLVLNLLAETLAATSLIGGENGLSAALAGAGSQSGMWSMHYGFAVISIASAIAWVWPHRDSRKVVTAVLGMLMTFHVALLISLASEGPQTQMVGIVIHSVLAGLAVVLFALRGRWCTQD